MKISDRASKRKRKPKVYLKKIKTILTKDIKRPQTSNQTFTKIQSNNEKISLRINQKLYQNFFNDGDRNSN